MRRKREGNPQKVLNQKLPITAGKIQAARALYQSEEIQRIEMKIDTPYGDTMVIEMSSKQCFELIAQLSSAYNAINPPLNPQRFGV